MSPQKEIFLKMAENLLKYADLENEIERIWDMKVTTTPVAIGAPTLVKKRMEINSKILVTSK